VSEWNRWTSRLRSRNLKVRQQLAEQLAKTTADLQTLGEQFGALGPTWPKVISLRRARITFVFVLLAAALVGWLIWEHWHSLLVAFAPLIWIFGHGFRWHRNSRSRPEDRS
jgi:Flp pilus assembly protein TadB